jgi:hypothetical protein
VENLYNSVADAYLLPGQLVTSAASSGLNVVVGDKEFLLSVFISTVLWFLLLAFALNALRMVWRTAANTRAAVVTMVLNFRTKQACRKRSPTSRAQSAASDSDTEVHFDNLDLAVLNSAATLGPGFALTAPDLANEFNLRPRQLQSSLEKLAKNMMLERGFGAAEDYQNYRLSQGGAAFLSMGKRKRN